MAGTAIEVRGLRKRYGDLEAVAGIDLSIEEGEVFALLGPNGAGKTTTVEILEGYRQRTAGEVSVLGFDPAKRDRALRQQVGIVLQSTGVDPYLTVAETIDLFRGYYPSPRPLDEVIELVGLAEKRDTRVLQLSGGQQRRLDVAIALAGDGRLLFLDEPTTGFDPSARRHAWDVVKNLAAIGKTVFLTTHFMDEAQYLANRVAVIANGRIVAEGPPSTLGGRSTADTIVSFRLADGLDPGAIPDFGQARTQDGSFEIRTRDAARTLHDLTGWAIDHAVRFETLEARRPSLEDVYLALTSDRSEDGGVPAEADDGTTRRSRRGRGRARTGVGS
jgi:ABC-2 type transport system ATP-binding protein